MRKQKNPSQSPFVKGGRQHKKASEEQTFVIGGRNLLEELTWLKVIVDYPFGKGKTACKSGAYGI